MNCPLHHGADHCPCDPLVIKVEKCPRCGDQAAEHRHGAFDDSTVFVVVPPPPAAPQVDHAGELTAHQLGRGLAEARFKDSLKELKTTGRTPCSKGPNEAGVPHVKTPAMRIKEIERWLAVNVASMVRDVADHEEAILELEAENLRLRRKIKKLTRRMNKKEK